MKKRFTFSLPEEATETVRAFLHSQGQTFSGWMSIIVEEFAKEICGQPSVLGKRPEEMTLKEFAEVFTFWWRKANEPEDEEQ